MDPLVISAMLGRVKVHQNLVDNRSLVNILFKDARDKMRLAIEDVIPCNQWLHAFMGEDTMPLGRLDLFVEI